VANARRILPAIYETILSQLVLMFRSETVDVFFSGESGSRSADLEAFIVRLNERVANALPDEISELVEVRIEDIDVETYFMKRPQEELFSLRAEERMLRDRELDRIDDVRGLLRNFVSSGSSRFSSKIDDAEAGLMSTIDREVDLALETLAGLDNPELLRGMGEVRASLHKQRQQAHERLESGFSELRRAFRGLDGRVGEDSPV
jgi:hypothetical protein